MNPLQDAVIADDVIDWRSAIERNLANIAEFRVQNWGPEKEMVVGLMVEVQVERLQQWLAQRDWPEASRLIAVQRRLGVRSEDILREVLALLDAQLPLERTD